MWSLDCIRRNFCCFGFWVVAFPGCTFLVFCDFGVAFVSSWLALGLWLGVCDLMGLFLVFGWIGGFVVCISRFLPI